jgi:replicative DNA helicase
MSATAQKTQQLKIPPHSVEAEQAVLGGLMLDNQTWDHVSELIVEGDFYRYDHRLIFRALAYLATASHPMDAITVMEQLKSINELENAGGEVYLFELAKNTPSAANIAAYANIVKERSVLCQLISISTKIADSAFNPEGKAVHELLDEAERRVFEIAEKGVNNSGPSGIKALLTQAVEKIDHLYHSDSAITGLATGFTDFDDMTSGLQPSDLVIVAARPSMGKTTFAMNLAENAAIKSRQPVLVFSMEMPGDALALRMMSSLGRINQHHLRTGNLQDDDWPRLTSSVSMLSEAPLFIDDTPGLSPSDMRSRARRLVREHGSLGLIVVDYLQLMHMPGFKENRTNEISEISRSLKSLARELSVPVVALSQLNRSLEQRSDKRPIMSDLRESGAIEQDADIITFIYRDEVYHEETPDKGLAEIIIAKQRNGPIGKVKLTFLGQYTKFENYLSNQYDPNSLP